MDKLFHKLLDLYLKRYLRKNRGQIGAIEKLTVRPKRFLAVSSTALGDTLLSTPALKSLKKSFPDSRVTGLIHKRIQPLMKDYPYLDDLVIYHGGYKHFFRTVNRLRDGKPEAVLIFHGNGPQDIALAVLSGASFILKHPTDSEYQHLLSHRFQKTVQHAIEERLDLVRKIGGQVIESRMELPLPENKEASEKIKSGLPDGRPLIGFQIGAANRYKMWPREHFIALGKKILDHDPRLSILITGNRKEYPLAETIRSALKERVFNTCGNLSVSELPFLIKKLDLLITNDTGTLHLAVALGIKTLSLFSATDSQRIGPYQDPERHRVIQKEGGFVQKLPKGKRSDEAMRLISVEEVFDCYERIMHHRPI